uniref:Leucine-rich repeat-containing N-terminal plant-type domain-containing protein n=1 Tax=Chenopodium quinoa TaxID=63459 RepID=A0A803KVT5_CHEQI
MLDFSAESVSEPLNLSVISENLFEDNLIGASECHDDEKSLLLELKNNLTFTPDASGKLRDWNESIDCCQWNHVESDNSTGRVIGLELYYLNITGGINNSSSIFHLQYLQTLDLGYNYIQGSIPTSIFTMPSLQEIFLDESPDAVHRSPAVRSSEANDEVRQTTAHSGQPSIRVNRVFVTLDLHSNNFHGKFPIVPYILDNLDCSSNHFTSIDPDFGPNLIIAYFLSFSNNNLRGSFPAALQYALNLCHLNLEFNHLNGNIPDYFINMSLLNVVNLRGNNLKGSIPAIFGNQYCYLETLDLNGNFLQGRVPRSLANCKAL